MTDGAATFRSPPDAYERFMGRWSRPLARAFCEAVGMVEGMRIVDVGCGAGALTAELADVRTGELVVERRYESFDDFWEPFTLGIGPGGAHCVSLAADARAALRRECFRRLGEPTDTFTLTSRAWLVSGTA